jgi:hypothetical protein
MRRANDFFGGLQTALWKRALMILFFGGLAFFGGYFIEWKMVKSGGADNQAITRDEYSYPRPESEHASNS